MTVNLGGGDCITRLKAFTFVIFQKCNWGGFFYTAFYIDPKEQMIVFFMAQLHPTGDLHLDKEVKVLSYQAIID